MRTEDGYIVHRCLNGEPEAFGLLIDRYKEAIYAFAYVKLRNFHDVELNTRTLRHKDTKKDMRRQIQDSGLVTRYSSLVTRYYLVP